MVMWSHFEPGIRMICLLCLVEFKFHLVSTLLQGCSARSEIKKKDNIQICRFNVFFLITFHFLSQILFMLYAIFFSFFYFSFFFLPFFALCGQFPTLVYQEYQKIEEILEKIGLTLKIVRHQNYGFPAITDKSTFFILCMPLLNGPE